MDKFEIATPTTGEPVTEQAPAGDTPATPSSTPSSTTPSSTTPSSTTPAIQLPAGYLSYGYYATTDKGQSYLRPELVSAHAMDIAAKLSSTMKPSDFASLLRGLKSAKKRTLPFEARITAASETLPKALALVHRKKAPQILTDFIRANLNAIQTDEDFTAFYRHFEAVYNFIAAGGDF